MGGSDLKKSIGTSKGGVTGVLNADTGLSAAKVGTSSEVASDDAILREFAERSILNSKSSSLYNFSCIAAKHASSYSNGKVDSEGIYQMVCDAVSSVLIPEQHISGHMLEERILQTLRGTYESRSLSLGYRSEVAASEVVYTCANHVTQDFSFLRPYLKAHNHSHILKYACDAVNALMGDIETGRTDTPVLNVLYGSFLEHFETYKDHSDDDKPLSMAFIEGHEELYSSLKSCDRKKFFAAMKHMMVRDSSAVKNIFFVIAQHIPTFKHMYNNVLLCALLLNREELATLVEQKYYIRYNAAIALNVLIKFSPTLHKEITKLLNPLAPNELIKEVPKENVDVICRLISDNLEKFSSLVNIPVYSSARPLVPNDNHGLEKIAAIHLILYPGSVINGEDILLSGTRPILLNVGTGKLNPNTQLSGSAEIHTKIAIMEDIQKIFSSLQEMCGHLDCVTFIDSLKVYCAMMRSSKHATAVKDAISLRMCVQLPEYLEIEETLSTVAFESILPRVAEIEEFLQDERIVKITMQYTRLLHNSGKLILSAADFLRVCGYYDTNSCSFINDCTIPTSLLTHIENNYRHFSAIIPVVSETRRKTPRTSAELQKSYSQLIEGEKYKISMLSSKERNTAVKQLASRSIFRILYHITVYISPLLAAISVVFTIGLALSIQQAPVICAFLVPIMCTLVIFLASYIKEQHERGVRKYIMSLPPTVALQRACADIVALDNETVSSKKQAGDTVVKDSELASTSHESLLTIPSSCTKQRIYPDIMDKGVENKVATSSVVSRSTSSTTCCTVQRAGLGAMESLQKVDHNNGAPESSSGVRKRVNSATAENNYVASGARPKQRAKGSVGTVLETLRIESKKHGAAIPLAQCPVQH